MIELILIIVIAIAFLLHFNYIPKSYLKKSTSYFNMATVTEVLFISTSIYMSFYGYIYKTLDLIILAILLFSVAGITFVKVNVFGELSRNQTHFNFYKYKQGMKILVIVLILLISYLWN